MQETRLAQELVKCVGISVQGRGEALKMWNGENTLGCLGDEVRNVINETSSVGDGPHVSILKSTTEHNPGTRGPMGALEHC